MVELLCLLRTTSTWHFLLAVCAIDVIFILVQMSNTPPMGESKEEKLQQVLKLQEEVSRGIEENTRLLQHSLRVASLKSQSLDLISQGVDDLEKQISRLKQELNDTGD